MQTEPHTLARPEAVAERLARDLAEMREDRDRWRGMAERLVTALERQQGQGPQVLLPELMRAPAPSSADLKRGRRERHAAKMRAKREAAGATPRDQSKSQTKPWVEAGLSRSTWYKQRCHENWKPGSTAAADAAPANRG